MWDSSDTELFYTDRSITLSTRVAFDKDTWEFKGRSHIWTKSGSYLGRVRDVFVTRWSFDSLIDLSSSIIMDLPRLDVDVDLGFALFFLALLCLFLLATMVRCAQMVLDPFRAISAFTYQEEELEGWRLKQADWEPLDCRRTTSTSTLSLWRFHWNSSGKRDLSVIMRSHYQQQSSLSANKSTKLCLWTEIPRKNALDWSKVTTE